MREDREMNVGDIVQIKANAKRNAGAIGRIIGSRLSQTHKGDWITLYTVKFSDTESDQYSEPYLQRTSYSNKL